MTISKETSTALRKDLYSHSRRIEELRRLVEAAKDEIAIHEAVLELGDNERIISAIEELRNGETSSRNEIIADFGRHCAQQGIPLPAGMTFVSASRLCHTSFTPTLLRRRACRLSKSDLRVVISGQEGPTIMNESSGSSPRPTKPMSGAQIISITACPRRISALRGSGSSSVPRIQIIRNDRSNSIEYQNLENRGCNKQIPGGATRNIGCDVPWAYNEQEFREKHAEIQDATTGQLIAQIWSKDVHGDGDFVRVSTTGWSDPGDHIAGAAKAGSPERVLVVHNNGVRLEKLA